LEEGRALDLPEPYLKMALVCERVLIEKDNTISFIRSIDRIVVSATGPTAPESIPPGNFSATIVSGWAGGLGPHEGQVRIMPPRAPAIELPTYTMQLNSIVEGHNHINQVEIPLSSAGTYWFEFLLNGKIRSRIPFQIIYLRSRTPKQPPDNA
jgi:hypothetical protein